MEKHIDIYYDNELLNLNGLTWLPWIGKNFKNNKKRLLIVGESHYALGDNDEEYQKRYKDATDNKTLTRECIYESPVCGEWRNNTFDNIHRVLLRSNDFDKELFWEQVAFYNFIQRLMDYRVKERPTWVDFYSSWKTFIELIKILKPTDCIFIGVSASNSYNQAMEELRVKYEPVKWLEGIGTAYARTATISLNDDEIKLSFIQHASKMFSWSNWNTFLSRENGETLAFLKSKVYKEEVEVIPEEILEPTQNTNSTLNIPMYLSHKPIIACDYLAYTNANDDAKYLSIGHAQYDYDAASIKIFRHTGEKWSRQSEELPINRVGDMALLLLSAMKKVYKSSSDNTILNEVTLKEDELDFLRNEFESNKERIKGSFLEIKRLLNDFDIENI
jgi:hypothetical protein